MSISLLYIRMHHHARARKPLASSSSLSITKKNGIAKKTGVVRNQASKRGIVLLQLASTVGLLVFSWMHILASFVTENNETLLLNSVGLLKDIDTPTSTSICLEVYYWNYKCQGDNITTTHTYADLPTAMLHFNHTPKSIRVTRVEFQIVREVNYLASVVELEGCVKIIETSFRQGQLVYARARRSVQPELQTKFSTARDQSKPHIRIVLWQATSPKNTLDFRRS